MPEAIEKVFGAIAGDTSALHLLEASAAPTATDDESKGFSTGSVWFKKTTGDWWTCSDATAGAAVWNELSTGGGGDESVPTLESATLIAFFNNPAKNYNTDTYVWTPTVASGEFLLGDPGSGQQPSGVSSDNRITTDDFDMLIPNAALLAALAIDDLTIVAGLDGTDGTIYAAFLRAVVNSNTATLSAASSAGLTTARDGDYQARNSSAIEGYTALKGRYLRDDRGYLQVNNDTEIFTTGTVGDAALVTSSGLMRAVHGFGGSCGFVAFYSGSLDSDDWTTLLTHASDNAAYGSSGVSFL
jgi:hypothetical protein